MRLSVPTIYQRGRHYHSRPLAGWAILVAAMLLSSLFTVLNVSPASAAAITHVQRWNQDMNYTSSLSKAFTTNNTAGNAIIVSASWSTTVALTCSDTQGNVYAYTTPAYYPAQTQSLGLCYALNIAAGPNTVTVSFASETDSVFMTISEYSGIATSSAIDGTASNFTTGSTVADAITSTSLTTTTNNDLIFGATNDAIQTGGQTITAGTGYTQVTNGTYQAAQSKILAAFGSTASTMTFSTNHAYLAVAAAFKPAGAPAITHVQSANRQQISDTELRASFSSNTSAGNTVVAAITWAGTATLTGCTDTAGNTYTTAVNQYDATGNRNLAVCYSAGITGGADSVIATLSSNSDLRGISVHEYSGISAVSPTDGSNYRITANTATVDGTTANNITTTANRDLIFGALVDQNGAVNSTHGTGFVWRGDAGDVVTEDKTQIVAGTTTAAFTNTNTVNRYIAAVVAFKSTDTSAYINMEQSEYASNNATNTTITKAFPNSNTSGNTIVAVVSYGGDGTASATCSDSKNNNYSVALMRHGNNYQNLAICYATNIASGSSNTVTVTFSASVDYRRLLIFEYSGISITNPVDAVTARSAVSTTTVDEASSGSVTTTTDNDLIFGALIRTSGAAFISSGTGFDEGIGIDDTGTETKLQTSAGVVASTWTLDDAVSDYTAATVAFRPATAPAGASTVSNPAGSGFLIYGGDSQTTPQWRQYNNSAQIGAAGPTIVGAVPKTMIARTSPIKQEAIAGYLNSTGTLRIMCYNGSVWTNEWSVSVGGSGINRPFDIAYETSSGDAIVLYGTNASGTNEMAYRTKPAGSACGTANWASASNLDSSQITGTVNWIHIASDKRVTSDLLTAVWADSASRLSGMQWSGSGWVNEHTSPLSTTLGGTGTGTGTNVDSLDVEYESISGDVMIVYGDSTGTNAVNGAFFATCTGGTSACSWTVGASTAVATGDDATNLDLSANPLSDEMVLGTIGDAGSDLQILYWSGTAWTLKANWDTSTATLGAQTKLVTTGWMTNGTNTRSIVIYSDSGTGNASYYLGNGTGFGSANTPNSLDVTPDFSTPEKSMDIQIDPLQPNRIMFVASDSNSALYAKSIMLAGASTTLSMQEVDGNQSLGAVSQSTNMDFAFAFWRKPIAPERSKLAQTGTIFENDDEDQSTGDAVDENTQQAAANTTITSVKKGERITSRFQLKNTGGASLNDLGLFYDRNDGYWTRVNRNTAPIVSSGSCSDTNFDCTGIATGNDVGSYASVAIDKVGRPWVAFYDATGANLNMRVAQYVGIGGSGCASTAWTCTTVDSTNDVGSHTSIAIDAAGNPWVSYYDNTGHDLRIAKFVGSGGSNCSIAAWDCTSIDTTNDVGQYSSLGFDATGRAWISYYDVTNLALRVAQYVGTGGSNCAIASWNCTAVTAAAGNMGTYSSLAFDAAGKPWVSFYDAGNGDLIVASYTYGSLGSNCASSSWTCTTIDSTGTVGEYSSLAFDPLGNAWVSYYDNGSNHDLRVAQYDGDSTPSGCALNAWTCTSVETSGDVGMYTSIAFDPAGKAWVTYYDNTNHDLRLARYDGTTGSVCASSVWKCTAINSTGDVGKYSSLAFDVQGVAWINSYDAGSGDLHIANLKHGGDLVPGYGLAGYKDNPLNESHADMSSSTDTTNRDDADCIGGGTWNQGKWFSGDAGSNEVIADGTSGAQCTEVAFVIDTSTATASATYRLLVSSGDSFRPDRGSVWRGPISVTNYATLTLEASTISRITKDSLFDMANCSADTAWGCTNVFTGADDVSGFALAPDGNPWVSFSNSSSKLVVGQFVGSGGSGCSNSAWTCTSIDGASVDDSRVAFSPSGVPWVEYHESSSAWVATYVGSGGVGCDTSAWTCQMVDGGNGNNVGGALGDIVFDSSGAAWMTYYDLTAHYLKVARYVGTAGTGCYSTAWMCQTVLATSLSGNYAQLAFDSVGSPWIATRVNANVTVAHLVGGGGTGCATGITRWNCETIQGTTGDESQSIAFDSAGVPWVSFYDNSALDLYVAKYDGDAVASGCTSAAWTCTNVDSTGDVGFHSSIAIDAAGKPWVAYDNATGNSVKVARYDGDAVASGCAANAWTCTSVDGTGTAVTAKPSLTFDASGTPWFSFIDSASAQTSIAKLHLPPTQLSYATKVNNVTRSARIGDGRYHLDHGDTARPVSGSCDALSSNKGYCGVAGVDSSYDSLVSNANQAPIYVGAFRSTSNSAFPSYVWTGQSNVAASSKNIKMEIYRFGTTNAWTALTSNTTVAVNTNATLTGTASSGSASEYWEVDGSNYWTYYRVYQVYNSSGETLKTDYFGLSNAVPNSPTTLAQYKSNGTTAIPGTVVHSYDVNQENSSDANGGVISVSNTVKRSGANALKDTTTAGGLGMWINDGNVATRDLSANGPTLSAWVYVPSANSGTTWSSALVVYDSSYAAFAGSSVTVPRDIWTLVTYTPPKSVLSSMTFLVVSIGGGLSGTDVAYVDDFSQGYATWTDQTSVVLKSTVSDTDNPDTDSLCVEVQPIATPFANSDTACGTGVTYSGTGVTASVTVSGLSTNTEYHWQARTKDAGGLYSSWVSYGGNSETTVDFGVDTTNPTTGTVYDGASMGVDANYNSGSLTSLSANWSGFADTSGSGIIAYRYSVGVTAGDTSILAAIDNFTTASMTASSLSLHTGQMYFVNVTAVDGAGNTSTISSNGQLVAPTLTFTLSSSTIDFAHLNSNNSFTDSKTLTATVTTNAYNGYDVKQYATGLMTSGVNTISMYAGTWASPTVWSGTGLGYTSSDASVSGSNRFASGSNYAGISLGSSDIVADSSTTAVSGDPYTLTYKLTTPTTQAAGRYVNALVMSATARF